MIKIRLVLIEARSVHGVLGSRGLPHGRMGDLLVHLVGVVLMILVLG